MFKGIIYMGAIALAFSLVGVTSSKAHPGRTDASGCHTCRTNCPDWGLNYGEYHCHYAKALPQPEEPIHSVRGEDGTGYTIPAPEYKQPIVQEIQVEPTPISNTTPVATPPPPPVQKPAPSVAPIVSPGVARAVSNTQTETDDSGTAAVVGTTVVVGGAYWVYRRFKKKN